MKTLIDNESIAKILLHIFQTFAMCFMIKFNLLKEKKENIIDYNGF